MRWQRCSAGLAKGVVIFAIISLTCIFSLFAQVSPTQVMDDPLKEKVASFLVERGYQNIAPQQGEVTPIQNGFFLKIDGLDKEAKKEYYLEIICTSNYTDWVLLAINEKDTILQKKSYSGKLSDKKK
ncbi:MAG: hypothetical protein WCG73_02605 [Candidatus Moraniibacteriota bacterium]